MTTLLIVIAAILMLVGLLGTLIPNFPDTLLIIAGAALLLARDGFSSGDVVMVVVLGLVALGAEGLAYVAHAIGAKKAGASWQGVAGALLGGLVGLIALQAVGILVGPLVGAVIGEMIAGRRGGDAVKAGLGAVAGMVGGVVLKFAVGVTMICLTVLSVLF